MSDLNRTVLCKLRVGHIQPPDPNLPDDPTWYVRMHAVYAGTSELQAMSENAIFGKYTPSADFNICIKNPDAATMFDAGAEYYVEIRRAPQALNADQIAWLQERIAALKNTDVPHERSERTHLESLLAAAAPAVSTAA